MVYDPVHVQHVQEIEQFSDITALQIGEEERRQVRVGRVFITVQMCVHVHVL